MEMIKAALGGSVIFLVMFGCGTDTQRTTANEKREEIPETVWQKVTKRKIYFGHQSVGNNILAGISDIIKESGRTDMHVAGTRSPAEFAGPVFAHSSIGENEQPLVKINDFAQALQSGIGNTADFAMMKLCYVDINAGTDVAKLFDQYRTTMSKLKASYPKTRIIHMTVPLTTLQSGWKGWVKKMMGKPVSGYLENIKRQEYNMILRKEYEGKEPLFDLAKIESTFPDGRKSGFQNGEKFIDALVPEYTDDGGHLNNKGRDRVARQLLLFIASIP
jgi:lysophospholipase L1-like esterase